MELPNTLGIAGREAAQEAVAALQATGESLAGYRGAILRYGRAVDDVAQLRAEWEECGKPGLAFGSKEQLVQHPLVIAVREAEEHAAKMADRLGLSLSARASIARRTGHPSGVGQADDRKSVGVLRRVPER